MQNTTAKRRMYRLINPDPLRQHTVRSIAQAARCSKTTVADIRAGRLEEVSERLASSIADAVGVTMDVLFAPADRMSWERTQ